MKTKFNINRKKISDGEIDNYQDYDKLTKQYNKMVKPFYQTRWFWGAAGAALVVIVVMNMLMHLHHKKIEIAVAAKDSVSIASLQQRFINPPMQNIDVPFSSYKIDAQKGGEINYKGSKLLIPQNCFADSAGNLINGEVEIRYREFHDVVDCFVSGIPMTYDSAGVQYTFESAGMMQIQGYLNNKPIAIAQGKMIDVKMNSNYHGSEYNMYYLDTLKRCWTYLGKDKMVQSSELGSSKLGSNDAPTQKETSAPIEKKCPAEVQLEVLQEKPKPIEPAKPVKAKEENYRFNIDVNTKEFPELSIYKDVLFEINPKHKDFDPKLYNVQWEDALLKKLNGDNNYELTLVKGEIRKVFSVYPVFEGEQYDEAKKVYDQKYQEYTVALDARKAEEKRLKAEAEQQKKEAIAKWEADKKAREEKQEEQVNNMIEQGQLNNSIMTEFEIKGFGIYNCDHPLGNPPQGAELTPCQFTDQNGGNIFQNDKNIFVYQNPMLADKDRNAMYTMGRTVKFNPRSESVLWCAMPNNKLGVYTAADFKKINQTRGSYTFKMNVIEVKNLEEMKALLKF